MAGLRHPPGNAIRLDGMPVVLHSSSTLLDRALVLLREAPCDAPTVATQVLGLTGAPGPVCQRMAVALLGGDPRVRQLPDGRWALQATPGTTPLLADVPYAVVDVETTGGQSGAGDRIIEVAVVVVQGTRRELVLDTLVNPGRPIPAVITRITGITTAMVAQAPTFPDIVDDIRRALAGRVLVAHNLRFDRGFLAAELHRAADLVLSGPSLCTVRLARRLVRGPESYGLDSLTTWFGWDNPARHRAAGDAWVTALLLEHLLLLAQGKEVVTLAELEALARGGRAGRRKGRGGRRNAGVPPKGGTPRAVLPPGEEGRCLA